MEPNKTSYIACNTQVSPMFHKFLGPVSSLPAAGVFVCVCVLNLCKERGLGQPNELILWHCWLSKSNQLSLKMWMRNTSIIMANLNMTFLLAHAVTYKSSLFRPKNLDKVGTMINTAKIGCRNCYQENVFLRTSKV